MTEHELIAVVGLAGRFPKAADVTEYWTNLVNGRECMTDLLDDDELLRRGESAAQLRDTSYVRRAPLIPDMEWFDARFFRMTPREAEIRDPQHRIFLETCHTLLESAGCDPTRYPGNIGIYAGVNTTRYDDLHLRADPARAHVIGELAIATSNHPDYVSTFTSYKLGLNGPAMTVATACSTSLVALHLACQALRAGECDAAIAGGVEVEWPYGVGYVYNPGGIYSPDGYCRPFDANAGGTVFGSGTGAVLLKRYVDALADGDTVYALVRGSAVTNDGSNKVAFSAPSVDGQVMCIGEALASARVDARSISYVEAHGTATNIGDPIEVKALARAFELMGGRSTERTCGLGSVKSNVGHLGPAAGIAGFIKTVLALHNELIPPSINFTEPNPALELEQTPFHIVTEAKPWPRDPAAPRRAGCSSFGIGGTNAHVVLEEAPATPVRAPDSRSQIVVTSAATTGALERARANLAKHLAWTAVDLEDVAHTLTVGRRPMQYRDAVVAGSLQEAVEALSGPADAAGALNGPIVFAFPGQAAQYPGMAHGLHTALPGFRSTFDSCISGFSDLLSVDLVRLWRDVTDESQLAETLHAQPLIFAVEYALASSLRDLGVEVDRAVGHSLGELVAAAVGGVFSFDDALHVVAERARAMQEMPRGGMLAVAAGEEQVLALLPDTLSLAAVNGRRAVVVSGPANALVGFAELLDSQGIPGRTLRTSHAYHSPLMAEAVARLRAVVEPMTLNPSAFPIASGLSGAIEDERLRSPDFWADQLVRPVRFADAATALLHDREGATVLEVGPGDTLTKLLRSHPESGRGRATLRPVLPRQPEGDEYGGYLRVLGDLWRGGHDLRWESISSTSARRIPLPTYPFERRRYFVDRPLAEEPDERRDGTGSAQHPRPSAAPQQEVSQQEVVQPGVPQQETQGRLRGPQLLEVTWTRVAPTPTSPVSYERRPALTFLPPDGQAAGEALTVLQRAGLSPIRVRPPGTGGPDRAVDSGDRQGVFDLVGGLAATQELPGTVVHALLCQPTQDPERDLEEGFFPLLWLIQAMQRYRAEAGLGRWELVLLTRFGADVTGSEPVSPARAMLTGLLRTLARELTSVTVKMVDIGERGRYDSVVTALREPNHPIIAVRAGQLWVPAVQPLAGTLRERRRLRPRGVYLITGGLGALGRSAAHALANTGLAPRLILASRNPGDGADTDSLVAELTAAGAEARIVAADVADADDMATVVRLAREWYGPINGVLHTAGIAGDGLLELRSRDQVERVFRAKVSGGLVLRRLLAAEEDLDFVVYYSSRAALTGLVGSGDYAAANAFLDALARLDDGRDRQVVAVNWPGWSGGGMATPDDPGAERGATGGATGGATQPAGEEGSELTFTGAEWFLDEHQVDGIPTMSGTTFVDLVLRAARERGLVAPALVVRDLGFLNPLSVTGKVEVRIELTPVASGFAVRVLSREAGAASWNMHAQGEVSGSGQSPADINLDELFHEWSSAERLPSDVSGMFTYGPRWDNVVRTARHESAFLIELSLPERYRSDLGDHLAHPALLDNATSVIQHDADRAHVPFLYRQATFFRALPAQVVAVARPAAASRGAISGDIDLYDRRGRQVASIKGFTMRQIDRAAFSDTLRSPSAAQADREHSTGDSATGLLNPDDGAIALLSLIESDAPSQVTVVPPGENDALPGFLHLAGRGTSLPESSATSSTGLQQRPDDPTVPVVVRPSTTPTPPERSGLTTRVTDEPTASLSVLERLRAVWIEIIGEMDLAPDDDFFDIGGNSLHIVRLIARIRETFDVELGVGQVFEKSSLRALSDEVERLTAK